MSELLEAALLGIVQGLTEFLPISSTGHLILTEKALGISQDDFGLRFDAAIHLGTLTAVLVYFRVMVLRIITGWLGGIRAVKWDLTPESRLGWLLIIGTIPAGILGLALEKTAEDSFRSATLVGVALILFCIPMIVAERIGKSSREMADMKPWDAVRLGFAQSMALIPGVSRSGMTISIGMISGFRREESAVFAFLLSGPIIAAAGGKQLFDILTGRSASSGLDNEAAVYAVGLITSAIVGYVAVAFLLRFLRSNSLRVFIGYRLILGALVLSLAGAGVL